MLSFITFVIIMSDVTWVIKKKLAASGVPEHVNVLDKWLEIGIRAVMVLIEPSEAAHLGGLGNYLKELQKRRFEFVNIPIRDFTAPTLETCRQAVEWIDEKIHESLPVLVHCRGGLGRTGTIVACYLVYNGMSDIEAINYVRTIRPGSIELEGQVRTVQQFYKLVKLQKLKDKF
jgi:atypical dual specificity phosphatase